MRDTNASRSIFHLHRAGAATKLVGAVAHSDECVRLVCQPGVSSAGLLDQAEAELSNHRLRCVRIHGSASGGLALRDLITQIVGPADPDALKDCDLEAGFVALTEPGDGRSRVVLLVDDAHNLQPSALHYIQFACQSGPKLRVVLAGQPSLGETLADDKFAYLRQRVTCTLEMPGLKQSIHSLQDEAPLLASKGAGSVSDSLALHRGRSWSWLTLGAAAPMALLLVLSMGTVRWLHPPLASILGTHASVAAPKVSALNIQISGTPVLGIPMAERRATLVQAGPEMPAVDASAAQAKTAGPVASRTSQPIIEAAPPSRVAAAPNLAEPAKALREHAGESPKPAQEIPASAPEPAAAAGPNSEADVAVPASLGATLDTPPPEKPVKSTGSGADAQGAPPASIALKHVAESGQAGEPEASLAPRAALSLPASAASAGPPLRTAAAVTQPPEALRRLRPGMERTVAAETALPIRSADERHCRDIVLYVQLGKNLSDADKQFLRDDCHAQ